MLVTQKSRRSTIEGALVIGLEPSVILSRLFHMSTADLLLNVHAVQLTLPDLGGLFMLRSKKEHGFLPLAAAYWVVIRDTRRSLCRESFTCLLGASRFPHVMHESSARKPAITKTLMWLVILPPPTIQAPGCHAKQGQPKSHHRKIQAPGSDIENKTSRASFFPLACPSIVSLRLSVLTFNPKNPASVLYYLSFCDTPSLQLP